MSGGEGGGAQPVFNNHVVVINNIDPPKNVHHLQHSLSQNFFERRFQNVQ
jgi:hypothetical protein